jgi:hypothetical protein
MKLNVVPANRGALWVRQGIRTFFRQPLALAGLFLMFMVAMSVLRLIPVLGNIIALAFVPGATLGLMTATQEVAKGQFPTPTVLLSAFRAGRQQLRAMLVLGVIYTCAVFLISVLVTLVDGGELAKSLQALGPIEELMRQPPEVQQAAMPALLSYVMQQLSQLLLMLILYTPVSLAFWHAPALTHWHGIPAVKSLFFSFVACLRNIKAIAAFSLYWAAVYFAVTMSLCLLGMLLGGFQLAMGLVVPATLLLMAMSCTSVYFSFRDTFAEETSESAQPSQDIP